MRPFISHTLYRPGHISERVKVRESSYPLVYYYLRWPNLVIAEQSYALRSFCVHKLERSILPVLPP